MIEVLYTKSDTRLSAQMFAEHLCRLPASFQTEIARFQRWQDQQARLFGKLLLLEGLRKFGYRRDILNSVSQDEFGRPYLSETVDFNLTHSGGYVACALAAAGKVGVDIEKIASIDIEDFVLCLTAEEFLIIQNSAEPIKKFYECWTIKESVLKADGRGLSIPMTKVKLQGKKAKLFANIWFFRRLDFAPGYVCHLATDIENSEINARRVRFRQNGQCEISRLKEDQHG